MAARRYRWSFRDAIPVRDASPRRDQGPKVTPQVFATDPDDADANAPGEQSPASGGPEEQAFDQNRRRVRLSGRDQETGQNFGAEVWLPQGYGGDRRTGDAALRTLVDRDPYTECSGLAELQRRLNQHYRS